MSRSNELIRSTPPTTSAIIALCCMLHLIHVLIGPDLAVVTMSPHLVLYTHDYYRIITSALYHGGLMHIGVNMMSTLAVGAALEKRLGTLPFLTSILWAILLTSTVYILMALMLSTIFGQDNLMYQHAVGFSGVIFHLVVLDCFLGPRQSRSLFGIISVPYYLYPLAMLFLMQVMVPNISFLGHLAGVITGSLEYYGAFSCLLLDNAYSQQMDSWQIMQPLRSHPSFVPTPNESTSREAAAARPALGAATGSALRIVGRYIKHFFETIWVIIFGRGAQLNINTQLQLPRWNASSTSSSSVAAPDLLDHLQAAEDDDREPTGEIV